LQPEFRILTIAAAGNMIGEVINWKLFWKRFRDHKTKFGNVLLTERFTDRIFKIPGAISASKYVKVHDEHKKMNHEVKMMLFMSTSTERSFVAPRKS
jgi:hypothetical protein